MAPICKWCAAHLPEDAKVCPVCGLEVSAAQAGPTAEAVGTEPAVSEAPVAAVDDNVSFQVPASLRFRIRFLEFKSIGAPPLAGKLAFLIGMSGTAYVGICLTLISLTGWCGPGPGCSMIIGAPLAGIFSAIGVGFAILLGQALVRSVQYFIDPEVRRAYKAHENGGDENSAAYADLEDDDSAHDDRISSPETTARPHRPPDPDPPGQDIRS